LERKWTEESSNSQSRSEDRFESRQTLKLDLPQVNASSVEELAAKGDRNRQNRRAPKHGRQQFFACVWDGKMEQRMPVRKGRLFDVALGGWQLKIDGLKRSTMKKIPSTNDRHESRNQSRRQSRTMSKCVGADGRELRSGILDQMRTSQGDCHA
jgi:hypothetical protein